MPINQRLVPIVIEQSGRTERAYDIFSRLLKDRIVFLGGTIADDTSVSMGEQTRNILGKIAGYLKEAGTDKSRVVSASIFVTDLSRKKEIDAAWKHLSKIHHPDHGGTHEMMTKINQAQYEATQGLG